MLREIFLAAFSTCTPPCRRAMMCLYLRHQAFRSEQSRYGWKALSTAFRSDYEPEVCQNAPPEKQVATRIEQYCKRRKDRMKPKRQEDSSCVFAYRFCRGTCHRRDTAGKESAPKSLRRRSRKELCKSRWDDAAGKSSRERQAPALYAAVRVRRRSYGVSRIP